MSSLCDPLLSIVVPLGPSEPEWPLLLDQLNPLPAGSEVILVGYQDEQRPAKLDELPASLIHLEWTWCTTEQGRAYQLNTGAERATGDYVWFLHADTILNRENVQSLLNAIDQYPERLFYFNLWFHDKETLWLSINEWGARFRSDVLGCPYGDQGFCISRTQFLDLKGYPTQSLYGEDHVFVWKARQNKIHLHTCGTRLGTSARKYHDAGWLNLTLKYQHLWLKQAAPEFFKWLRIKLNRNRV
ncbi:glycosyltransferase [Endozoicomonas numazuensis]|uniref:glycosyltransferase n=1 Tax=Endozoicomonas numazuensis TaxID=1137799 RepID=UPI00068A1C0B|nr:glycosyltransferase [Endozoicomonas numazuensis]